MASTSHSLSRRQAIKSAITLLGGAVTAAQLGPLAGAVTTLDANSSPRFLSSNQFSMLEGIVDTMIPATDTPGALSAGVHHFVDLMLADWASPETRSRYTEGFKAIDALAKARIKSKFADCTEAERLELLQAIDAEAYENGTADSFFRQLKKLVLFGYYSSAVGASVELRFDPTPGTYRGCIPLNEVGRAWFVTGFSYDL